MIDAQLSKTQILELYLNRIYLSAGVYGVETMSRHLFGKPAKQLTLAESALIAGLAQSPVGAVALDQSRRRASPAATSCWRGCARRGSSPPARKRRRSTRGCAFAPTPARSDARAGYAKEFLRQRSAIEFGGDHPPDWDVRTTFVPELQEAAERAVADGLRRFGRRRSCRRRSSRSIRATGDILALVGGRDFRQSQFNRAARSRRQPGSAFKPLLYAAALEHGYSPVSVLEGLANIVPQGPEEWSPRNANGETPDALTLRAALLESNNRAATMLQQKLGSRPVLRLASDVGLEGLPDVPSLSLGTGLVTPLDLTAAFATFPNGGLAVRPRGILRVIDADGVIGVRGRRRSRAGDLAARRRSRWCRCSRTSSTRGTGAAARQLGHPRSPIGGKTGTTNDFKDAWFVGFSSSIVVGVWVGIRSAADDRRATPTAPGTRCRSGAISCARRCRSAAARGEFAVPAGAARRTALPHLLPAAGRRLSRSTRSTSRKATRCRAACARSIRAPSSSA